MGGDKTRGRRDEQNETRRGGMRQRDRNKGEQGNEMGTRRKQNRETGKNEMGERDGTRVRWAWDARTRWKQDREEDKGPGRERMGRGNKMKDSNKNARERDVAERPRRDGLDERGTRGSETRREGNEERQNSRSAIGRRCHLVVRPVKKVSGTAQEMLYSSFQRTRTCPWSLLIVDDVERSLSRCRDMCDLMSQKPTGYPFRVWVLIGSEI